MRPAQPKPRACASGALQNWAEPRGGRESGGSHHAGSSGAGSQRTRSCLIEASPCPCWEHCARGDCTCNWLFERQATLLLDASMLVVRAPAVAQTYGWGSLGRIGGGLYGQLDTQGRDCAMEDVRENHSSEWKFDRVPPRACVHTQGGSIDSPSLQVRGFIL